MRKVEQDVGNQMTSVELQNHYSKVRSVNALLPHDTCLHRELSVVFHIVLDSSKQTGITLTDLDACINKLNVAWKPMCVPLRNVRLIIFKIIIIINGRILQIKVFVSGIIV